MNRVKCLKGVLLIVVGVITVRLFFVQILQHDEWVAKAESQHTVENTIVAKRGEIYMMDGDAEVAVVMNETVYTVIVDPMAVDEEKAKAAIEKNAKGNMVAKWEDVFQDKTKRYFVVARNVPRASAKKIQEEEIYGIMFQENTKRVYPEGELASGLLGFVNAEGEGQYGVEGALNERLAGKDGLLKTVADVNKVALSIGSNNVKIPAEDGENIKLTVDKNIQYATEKALKNGLERTKATNASAVVMNPNNGEILAVANLPTYNPAEYWNVESAKQYMNYAFEDPSEPASVCKTFAFAAGVDQGVLTPQTTYYNEGFMMVDDWKINNAYKGMLGTITIQDAFDLSLNTGSMYALKLLGGDANNINQQGREKLYEYYYNRFGLGRETGVELYESLGVVGDPNEGDGRDSLYANMTFGQNMQLTMVQVVSAFSSVVNGGKYYTPRVVRSNEENTVTRQTISAEASATMRQMLAHSGQNYANAKNNKTGYEIGGKTGTAQVIKDGKYILNETEATYIGYGAEVGKEPKYVIMVRIWGDGMAFDGGTHAMPIFTEISNFMLDYLKLKPAQ